MGHSVRFGAKLLNESVCNSITHSPTTPSVTQEGCNYYFGLKFNNKAFHKNFIKYITCLLVFDTFFTPTVSIDDVVLTYKQIYVVIFLFFSLFCCKIASLWFYLSFFGFLICQLLRSYGQIVFFFLYWNFILDLVKADT